MSEIQERFLMNMILSWMMKHLILYKAIGDPIDQMVVDAFSQITNLKSLDIGNNRITSLPDTIGDLQTPGKFVSGYESINKLTRRP